MTEATRSAVAAAIIVGSLAFQLILATKARAIEPIPGSIIFQGQPKSKLQKSPIGSTFSHSFYAKGSRYVETYRLGKDRSLELVSRQRLRDR